MEMNATITAVDYYSNTTYKSDIYQLSKTQGASPFGFVFGGGLILNNRVNISARYLNLGKVELSVNTTVREIDYANSVRVGSQKDSVTQSGRQPVSMLLLTLGINF
ncbi:hypothetical protein JW960_00025 [candidate division KSB1 bacterium]|nr:hypothetical protein [candidate division KSB1 bacterium]